LGAALHAFAAQLRLLARGPRYAAMLALFLGATLLSLETYHQRTVRELPVAVLDLDGTRITRTLALALDATPELRVPTDPPATLEDARAAMVRGTLAGVVLVPDGFTADLKRGHRAEVVVAVDMSNVLVGKTAARAAQRVLATIAAGAQLTALEKLGTPPSAALARAVPITVRESLAENPGSSFAVYVGPPLAYFFLHLLTLFLAWSVLGRPERAPAPGETLGRFAAVLAIALGLGLVVTYGFFPREAIVIASPFPVVALALAAFLATDLLFAAALAAVLRGGLFAFQATVLLGMLSIMLSGLTWPWDAIPSPLRAVALAIPFTAFGRAFRIFLHAPADLGDLARPLALLGAQSAAFLAAIAAARLAPRVAAALRRPA
jgi:ABC-2 type transport system permease protein